MWHTGAITPYLLFKFCTGFWILLAGTFSLLMHTACRFCADLDINKLQNTYAGVLVCGPKGLRKALDVCEQRLEAPYTTWCNHHNCLSIALPPHTCAKGITAENTPQSDDCALFATLALKGLLESYI